MGQWVLVCVLGDLQGLNLGLQLLVMAEQIQACKLKFGDLKGASLDTEIAMRDGKDNVKILFPQGQVGTTPNSTKFLDARALHNTVEIAPRHGT